MLPVVTTEVEVHAREQEAEGAGLERTEIGIPLETLELPADSRQLDVFVVFDRDLPSWLVVAERARRVDLSGDLVVVGKAGLGKRGLRGPPSSGSNVARLGRHASRRSLLDDLD